MNGYCRRSSEGHGRHNASGNQSSGLFLLCVQIPDQQKGLNLWSATYRFRNTGRNEARGGRRWGAEALGGGGAAAQDRLEASVHVFNPQIRLFLNGTVCSEQQQTSQSL